MRSNLLYYGDNLDVLRRHVPDESVDLVYLDPPYIPASVTSSFTSYTADGFGMADQVRLRDLANDLRARGVHVVISNSDTPATRELFDGWHMTPVMRRGNVSCKGDGRQAVGELIISEGPGRKPIQPTGDLL